jgi:hypothetical protein
VVWVSHQKYAGQCRREEKHEHVWDQSQLNVVVMVKLIISPQASKNTWPNTVSEDVQKEMSGTLTVRVSKSPSGEYRADMISCLLKLMIKP